jgi:hypothetical protein
VSTPHRTLTGPTGIDSYPSWDATTPARTGFPWRVQLAGEPAAVESVLRGVVMLAEQAPQLSDEELRSRLIALGGLVR